MSNEEFKRTPTAGENDVDLRVATEPRRITDAVMSGIIKAQSGEIATLTAECAVLAEKVGAAVGRNAIARAICIACDDNPDHIGDARGNAYRWQDYLDAADAAIEAGAAPVAQPSAQTTVPEGWITLSIVFNEDHNYPEEVAYGPPDMMARLGKKLDKYYADLIAKRDAESTKDREAGAAVVWNDALAEVRATVAEMQNNLETFGEYSQETARCVLDGVLDSIDELLAQPYEAAELCGYALVPLRATKEMQAAWDGTPDGEDNDVLFAHAYSRMLAASTKAPIPRWDQLVNWYGDQPAITLMVEGMKAENAALRAALIMKDSHAS